MLSIRRMVIRWCMWRLNSPKLQESEKLYYHFKLASFEEQPEIPLKIQSGFSSFKELNEYAESFLNYMSKDPNQQKRNFEYEEQEVYRDRYFHGYDYDTIPTRVFELYNRCKELLPKDSSLSKYPRHAGIMAVRLAAEFNKFKYQIGCDYESKTNHRGKG